MIGIYKITNPNGLIYIGSSKEIEVRIKRYKKLQCKSQIKLFNSLTKYGVNNHIFEIIEECTIEEIYKLEFYYGMLFNVLDREKGLNLVLPNITDKKIIRSEETRKRMSDAQKGKKMNLTSKLKMSNSQKGRKHSKKTKENMSLNNNNCKIILNLITGIFYNNTKEASIAYNINRNTLKNQLNGQRKNKTNLVYI